ncbi:MAG: hypothetical protein K0R66_1581 [Gammaproteobacteria bacterium]|nr:hypothetical protein [Gammaproteobacteria bacterium]
MDGRFAVEFKEAAKEAFISRLLADISGQVAAKALKRLGFSEEAVEASETLAAELVYFAYDYRSLEKPKSKEILLLVLFQALPFLIERICKARGADSEKALRLLVLMQVVKQIYDSPIEGMAYSSGAFLGDKVGGLASEKAQCIFYLVNILRGKASAVNSQAHSMMKPDNAG